MAREVQPKVAMPRVCPTKTLFAVAILTLVTVIGADSSPRPPCGAEPFPPYPDIDASPVVKFWDRATLGSDWAPPACTGWTAAGFSTLVTTAGRFRQTSGARGLLRRIGAISELKGVRYWSTTRKQWHILIVDAYALSEANPDQRRNDFTPDEIGREQAVHFLQRDNISGKATYQMRILSATADRIVFNMENVSPMKYVFLNLFAPGEMQSVYFLDRESDDTWRYYSLFRTGKKASNLTAGHEASSINRAVAYYRYLTGIPTDKEPPAAR